MFSCLVISGAQHCWLAGDMQLSLVAKTFAIKIFPLWCCYRSTQPGHPSVGRCNKYQTLCSRSVNWGLSGWRLRKRRSAPP